jgi:hypothetical protein
MIDLGPANFWNIQISADGSALLSAEGTTLIQDGDYDAMLPRELLDPIFGLVEQLRAVPQPGMAMCMHADDYQVSEFQSDFFRNECILRIEGSRLEMLYRASEDLIRRAPWRFLRARPKSKPAGA